MMLCKDGRTNIRQQSKTRKRKIRKQTRGCCQLSPTYLLRSPALKKQGTLITLLPSQIDNSQISLTINMEPEPTGHAI